MKKISAFIISFILIITVMVPISFAKVSAAFSFDGSLLTDGHYPGVLYEYSFKPDAYVDDIVMTFTITSGSNAITNLKFAKGDSNYILSFNVSPSITVKKDIEFEVTCRDKSNSSNKSTVKNTFHCGYKNVNYLENNNSKEFNIDNNLPIYIYKDDIADAKLIFDNNSYFEVDINKSDNKNNLFYNKNAIVDIANNTDANLYFMNFIASPAFSKTGTFYFYAPDAKYLYSYNGLKLTQLNTTVDDDFIKFKTRTLDNYVASDIPLNDYVSPNASSSSSGSSSVSQSILSSSSSSKLSSSSKSQSAKISSYVSSGKVNPGTGASDIANT